MRGLFTIVGLLLTIGLASAQLPGPPGQPGVGSSPGFSPYLNLLRQNNNTGGLNNTLYNYYGLVRPEVDLRNAVQGLNSQLQSQQQQIGAVQNGAYGDGGLISGHASYFMNRSGYFMTQTGGGGGGGNFGGGGTGVRPQGGIAGGGIGQQQPRPR